MSCKSLVLLLLCIILGCFTVHASLPLSNDGGEDVKSLLVRIKERVSLVSTEYGEISAVRIGDTEWGERCHLQFFTLEPDALFLPVILHADMVLFVHSGAGRLSWADEDGKRHVKLKSGDVFSLRHGSIFFVQSNLETEQRKLRIYAIFTNSRDNLHEPPMGAYSSIRDLVLGFDKEVLRAAFQVPIDELTSGTRQPAIVHAPTTGKKEKSLWEIDSQYWEVVLGRRNMFEINKKKSKAKAFNLFDQKPDFKNRYGQSLVMNKKNLPSLKRPNLSVFLVNLTAGAMMGPHWNPMASEVSIVLQGEGMITVVGPSTKSDSENHQSTRFHVGVGDVFFVPRLHPMVQIAFHNDSFVFMGFSSTTEKNHPQYLAGKASVLRTLEKQIVAMSFGATNMSKFDRFFDQQGESVILDCASCAEEEFRRVEEEIKKQREKEEQKRREEAEAARREEEAEAARREEEARKQQKEEAKREEEKRKRREEEEKRRREKEEEARRKEEEEEARRQEEEEKRRREEEEEEEAKRKEEEEQVRKQEEKEAARREEEAKKQREEEARREEEEARRQEEERIQREEEEARAREKEERQKREEEERARRQEEEKGQEEKSEEETREGEEGGGGDDERRMWKLSDF